MKSRKDAAARRREQAVDWLLRLQEPEVPEEEALAFRAWLARDPQNAKVYESVRQLMGDARSAILSDPTLSSYEARPASTKIRNLAVAGLLAASGLFFALDGPMRLRADALAGPGELPVVTLADGSRVQLNARSAIAYDFDGTKRTVRLLRGEAFFEVAKDAARPFAVEGEGGRVVALGTAFNVRMADDGLNVTVTEHAVQVTAGDAPNGVRVNEGEAVAVSATGVGAVSRASENALAWRDGRLVADNMTLSDVIAEIGRHSSARIIVAGRDLAERRVSGTFVVTDPQAALSVIEQTLQLKVMRLGIVTIVRM